MSRRKLTEDQILHRAMQILDGRVKALAAENATTVELTEDQILHRAMHILDDRFGLPTGPPVHAGPIPGRAQVIRAKLAELDAMDTED